MKKTWLGVALMMVGGFILGNMLGKLEPLMGFLGLVGYSMVLIGIFLIIKDGKE